MANYTDEKIVKPKRKFFPEDFDVTNWDIVEKSLKTLLDEKIKSKNDLIKFVEKSSELTFILGEEMAWRYINMTRFADDENYSKSFNDFYAGIISKAKPYDFEIAKKIYNSEFRNELDEDEWGLFNKIVANEIELFREENIPLQVKEQEISNRYGAEFSKISAVYEGEEKTLQQLGVYLKNPDRKVREDVWNLRMGALAKKEEEFNKIFDEMKELRIQQAKNAGFDNYRDYMHKAKGRFSYTPDDLFKFHEAVEKEVLPFLKELTENRRKKLNIDKVRPWDTSVDLDGKILKPFEKADELLDKSIEILYNIKPEFGINLNKMKNSALLDLENRKGKAPGGYNYPLEETGAPFIFMNAVGLHRDVVTLLHESGHAMHTFNMSHIKVAHYRNTPSEVAELASMSMELLSMEHWDKFYKDEEDLRKAKREQLEGTISFLPWCMIVDAFQHWIYTNPNHTVEERENYFVSLMDRFNTGVDWSGLENYKKIAWMMQLHIFEVPFYYIEYGMSQLGALAVYKKYKTEGKENALEAYQNFLRLGYSVPVDKLYEAAGIKFDFSADYIRSIVDFVKEELKNLE